MPDKYDCIDHPFFDVSDEIQKPLFTRQFHSDGYLICSPVRIKICRNYSMNYTTLINNVYKYYTSLGEKLSYNDIYDALLRLLHEENCSYRETKIKIETLIKNLIYSKKKNKGDNMDKADKHLTIEDVKTFEDFDNDSLRIASYLNKIFRHKVVHAIIRYSETDKQHYDADITKGIVRFDNNEDILTITFVDIDADILTRYQYIMYLKDETSTGSIVYIFDNDANKQLIVLTQLGNASFPKTIAMETITDIKIQEEE